MNSELDNSTAIDYCINKATPDGSNLYYATIFDDKNDKALIISFHAFLYELSEIIYECSDPGVARIKLQWWQDEIERLSNQQARHPVTRQIETCVNFGQNLKSSFENIIEYFNNFLFIQQTDSLESILSLYKSAIGEIWYQCAQQLEINNTDSLEIIRETGALIHYISCLQQPNTYINEIRCIIPASIIEQSDLSQLSINKIDKAKKQKEIFSPLLIDLKLRLDQTYDSLSKQKSVDLQHVLIMNRLAYKTCDEILVEGCLLFDKHISLTPLRKLWTAWHTRYLG